MACAGALMTPVEKQRCHGVSGTYSIYHWRSYLSMMVGREVSLVETDEFLREESDRQWNASHPTNADSKRLSVVP